MKRTLVPILILLLGMSLYVQAGSFSLNTTNEAYSHTVRVGSAPIFNNYSVFVPDGYRARVRINWGTFSNVHCETFFFNVSSSGHESSNGDNYTFTSSGTISFSGTATPEIKMAYVPIIGLTSLGVRLGHYHYEYYETYFADYSYTISVSYEEITPLIISRKQLSVLSDASYKSISITGSAAWTATTSDSWLQVSPSNGIGNGSIRINYSNNPSTTSRTGTVTVATNNSQQRCMITQLGKDETFAIEFSSSTLTVEGKYNTGIINVTSNTDWYVSSNSDWLNVLNGSGFGNQAVSFVVKESILITPRKAILTLNADGCASKTCVVTQKAGRDSLFIALSADVQGLPHTAVTRSVFVTANAKWSAHTDTEWISLEQNGGEIGTTSFRYSVTKNSSDETRTGTIRFSAEGCTEQILTVEQDYPITNDDYSRALDCDDSFEAFGPWQAQSNETHDGVDAVKLAQNTWSNCTLETSVLGPGTVSFYWNIAGYRTSSTFSFNDSPTCDELKLYIDGECMKTLTPRWNSFSQHSEESGWVKAEASFGEGLHTICWRFNRYSQAEYDGERTCWLDEVSIEYTGPQDNHPPVFTGTEVTYSSTGENLIMSWPRAEDDVKLRKYIVILDGVQYDNGSSTQIYFPHLKPGIYAYEIVAVDYFGNQSEKLSGTTAVCNITKNITGQGSILCHDTVFKNTTLEVRIIPDAHNLLASGRFETQDISDLSFTRLITSDVTISAAFRPMSQYTISMHCACPLNPDIIIEANDEDNTGNVTKYYENSTIVLRAELNDGYHVRRWIVNGIEYTDEEVVIDNLSSDLDVTLEVVSLYYSCNKTDNLICPSGNLIFDTSANPPEIKGDFTYKGVLCDGIAVFDFNYVNIGMDCDVTVTGVRPVALVSRTDMIVNTAFDVSGSIAGRAGGGKGGTGGKGGALASFVWGGTGGTGGSGGTGASYYSSSQSPTSGKPGTSGATGRDGNDGNPGIPGGEASLAFGQTTYVAGGNGGGAGLRGNRGSSAGSGGNGGSAGVKGSNGWNPVSNATAGGNGSPGLPGENGHNEFGDNDFSGDCYYSLCGGSGGSGAGGGGSGGSGGSGAGGGGGGGGGGCTTYPPYKERFNLRAGGDGGSGGNGGLGGSSGYGGAGGDGGDGGNGGGAIVLSTAGVLSLGKGFSIDISESNRTAGSYGNPGGTGDAGSSGDTGNGGRQGYRSGVGGYETVNGYSGAAGGNGGQGGSGGSGGNGGKGGDGGYGAPGMVKLAASLILAENGLLSASNGNGDTATNRCGGVTYISNMTDSALETHAITLDDAARVVVGYATLDDVLMVRSSYDDTVLVPVLGQLQGVHAGEYGLCEEDSFVLSDSVQRTLVSTVNGIRIERVSELYDGYDQLLFTNETSTTMNSVPVVINNGDPVVIETLPAGETWTIAAVAEATVSIEGMEETPFEYNLDDDGNAIIIGYHGNDANLVIPAAINGHQVTEIDTWAFAECETIVSVEIPNNVTVISDFAFSDCTNLRFVTIGAGVSEFGSNVFRECISLEAFNVSNDNEWFASKEGVLFNKEITKLIVYPPDRNAREYSVPDGVAVINALAFNSCENLISVVLPNSIREIGDGAFGSCSNLECINIPRNTSRIGNSAFMFCSKLESVNIPDSVTEMGHSVFFMGGLVSLSIGSGLTEFGYGAFARCYDLVNVTLSEGIEIISSGSFANCKSMTSIIIPRSVKLIRDGAFYGCDTLSDIHFNGEAPEFTPEYIPGYEEDKPDEWYPTPITFYVPRDMGWEEWDAPEGVTVIFESDPQILELQAGWNWVSFQILPKDSHRVNDVISINGFTVNDFILTNSGSAHFNGTEWVPADFTIEYGRLYQINTSADVMVEIRGMPSEVLEVAVSSGWNWISNPTMTVVTPDLLIHTGGWSVGDRIQNGSGAFVTFNGTNWIPSNGLTLGPGDGCQLFTKNPGKIDFNK